jgi:hypothetical protein
MEPDGINH